jgi:hypothetical protein
MIRIKIKIYVEDLKNSISYKVKISMQLKMENAF